MEISFVVQRCANISATVFFSLLVRRSKFAQVQWDLFLLTFRPIETDLVESEMIEQNIDSDILFIVSESLWQNIIVISCCIRIASLLCHFLLYHIRYIYRWGPRASVTKSCIRILDKIVLQNTSNPQSQLFSNEFIRIFHMLVTSSDTTGEPWPTRECHARASP